MNESYLWMPYDLNWRSAATTAAAQEDQEDEPADELEREVSPRLFVEEWIRLSQRSLVPPRAIGIVDYTGRCSALVDGLCAAAAEVGARHAFSTAKAAAREPISTRWSSSSRPRPN